MLALVLSVCQIVFRVPSHPVVSCHARDGTTSSGVSVLAHPQSDGHGTI